MDLKWQKIAFKLLKRCKKIRREDRLVLPATRARKADFWRKRRIWRFWALLTIFARSGANLSSGFFWRAAQRKIFFRKKQNKRNLHPWNSKKKVDFFRKKKLVEFCSNFFLNYGSPMAAGGGDVGWMGGGQSPPPPSPSSLPLPSATHN